MTKVSRERLASTIQSLEQELGPRIEEGAWARVKRYFFYDPKLRKMLAARREAEAGGKDVK